MIDIIYCLREQNMQEYALCTGSNSQISTVCLCIITAVNHAHFAQMDVAASIDLTLEEIIMF